MVKEKLTKGTIMIYKTQNWKLKFEQHELCHLHNESNTTPSQPEMCSHVYMCVMGIHFVLYL